MIFITGASSGIGEATAHAFAAEKKDLLLVARRKDRLEAVASELRKKHRITVHSFVLDVTEAADVIRFADEHAKLFAQVEILINNAGLASGLDPIQEGNLSDWNAMIDTNVKGLLSITRAVLPHFLEKHRGHIVNLGSAAGFYTYPKGNVYCASKAAVKVLTEGMRMDLSGTGIRVTEVSPGMVETDFSLVRLRDPAKAKKVYEGLKPLTPQDVAETILWCVNRPSHVNIQEVILYPTDQASTTLVHRRS